MNNPNPVASLTNEIDSASPSSGAPEFQVPLNFSQGDLGQIQEILFGNQLRANNERLAALRSAMDTRVSETERAINSRLNAMSEEMDNGLEALKTQIIEKDQLQSSQQARFNTELSQARLQFSAELQKASGDASEQQQKLMKDFEAYRIDMEKLLSQSRDELLAHIEKALSELNAQKLDRDALSGLLSNLATQLSTGPNDRLAERSVALED